MAEAEIRKYATTQVVGDDVPDDLVHGPIREMALAGWLRAVEREGYRPLLEPVEAMLDIALFPQCVEDPDTGEKIKLPDRQWRVYGRVVRDDVPLTLFMTEPPIAL